VISKLLVANRGEIAVRIMRTCQDLGVATVAVYSEDDASAFHVRMADSAIALAGRGAASYLAIDEILRAVIESGADAVHPGYGFLSERAEFADAVDASGAIFVGPPGDAIRAMGDKVSSRQVALAAGVPIVPGTGVVQRSEEVVAFGEQYGWPVAIKASYGGGGRGMRVVNSAAEAGDALASARSEALTGFGRDECYVERYLTWPRHIEVQVLADQHGQGVWIGDRDCSVQRRHQKIIEECPAPGLDPSLRRQMGEAAVAVALACGYTNAGTIEMLYQDGEFFFLEMNTRLQVEHPVTELVYGIDLVAEQLHVAAGGELRFSQDELVASGHSMEFRINAERVAGGRFLPSPGRIARLDVPHGPGVRWDGGYETGDEVGANFDNLIGKLVIAGPNREVTLGRSRRALKELRLDGVPTNVAAHRVLIDHDDFVASRHSTRWMETTVVFDDDPADEPAPEPSGRSNPGSRGGAAAQRRYAIGDHVFVVPRLDEAATASPDDNGFGSDFDPGQLGRRKTVVKAGNGVITSPMQGTVVRVLVQVGDHVEVGQIVCVVEAMKMENSLAADCAGDVTAVDASAGQSVVAGAVLLTIEPSQPSENQETS
jgi:acetyl-CoA/propionyl-CoA carboxylase, biotin carboxylase, biotin carboxyl carrier protein